MATHSRTLAWKIPWTEDPGRLHTVHEVANSRTRLNDFTFTFNREKQKTPQPKINRIEGLAFEWGET